VANARPTAGQDAIRPWRSVQSMRRANSSTAVRAAPAT
jgi:hypothetical protein